MPDETDASTAESASSSADGPVCQNCGVALAGSYCHECGQRHVPVLAVRYLVRRFFESALDLEDLERGIGQTFLQVARNPGRVARRYVEGERKAFVNPIGYFLLTATITFLVFVLFREAWVQGQAEVMRTTWQSLGIDPAEPFQPGSLYRAQFGWTSTRDLAGALFDWVQQTQTYVGLLNSVVAAALLGWFFPERRFAETLVFEFYVTAQATLFLGVLAPFCFWISPAFIGILPLFLQTGLHVHGGGAFFETEWNAYLLPPLVYLMTILMMIVASAGVTLLLTAIYVGAGG
jgi:hypothetical protein